MNAPDLLPAWIFLLGLLPIQSPAGTPPPRQEEALKQLVSRISDTYRPIQDLEMPFVQKKFITILKDPIVSSGTLLWKPGRVLFRTRDPHPSEVLITDPEILLWIPELQKVEKYDRKKFPLMESMSLGLGPDVEKMISRYTATLEARHPVHGESSEADLVKLVPLDDRTRKYIQELWLWVRRKDTLIFRVEYRDSTGDRTGTEFDLEKRKINQGLADDSIRLSAPADIPIVEPMNPGK